MRTYKLVNNLTGWFVFLIAAFTYCATIEPTASFWDCPEFITTAYRLEIGHPPGAPFFMLLGNFFTLFASDVTDVAKMINIMSALLSAGCILFLFWSITHLARKLMIKGTESPSTAKIIAVMAAGVAGALIYTWSDTFWFSAVEGEVYAFSSFMTALVFWLILKWEDQSEQPHSDRWLVLIAYLAGLSIGVHLLNLLCIPAIVLVVYFKKKKEPTFWGSVGALILSFVIVVTILYGIIPGVVKMGAWFDLYFVNGLGFSYNSGFYCYLFLLVASLVWALYESYVDRSKGRIKSSFWLTVTLVGIPFLMGADTSSIVVGVIIALVLAIGIYFFGDYSARVYNTATLCITMIVIGYSSYAVTVIRSKANPPMDQNSPEDAFALQEYLNREQYGDRPLLFGQTFNSKLEWETQGQYMVPKSKVTRKLYSRVEKTSPDQPDQFVEVGVKKEYLYPKNQCMLFPRIYDDGHAQAYRDWIGDIDYKAVPYSGPEGPETVMIPTQSANLDFFFSYQLNFMYWRYFLWNFAGRQNDIQSHGELHKGNWLTGFSFIDNWRLGDQSLLPSDLQNNKGHNVFYCLPLILGLLGFFWQASKGKKGIQQFWVVFFLFILTGVAIVLYLNQTPQQPRERDYAYAGSFYAFAIWCGLGITAIYEWLKGLLSAIMKEKGKRQAALIASVLAVLPAVAVPLQMVSQTWDDHDRSGRFMCRDFGLNYLESIPKDGVIFTNGDNDTFPLWYNEDTEGNRTDVRVCNLSYLQTDWYIDQMKRPAFSGDSASSPLPITWERKDYFTGVNEVVKVNPILQINGQSIRYEDFVNQMFEADSVAAAQVFGSEPFELTNIIDKLILNDSIDSQFRAIPSSKVYVTVDKDAVRKSGMMIPGDSIPDRMEIDLSASSHLIKSQMMVLEMIARSNFSRPLYVATTVGASNYGNLYKNFIQEGLVYRISPFTFQENTRDEAVVDLDKSYDNLMNKYRYGNLKQEGLYLDETTMRMCYTHRRWFTLLITKLVEAGDKKRAVAALKKLSEEIPAYNVPHSVMGGSHEIGKAYFDCGMRKEGKEVYDALYKECTEYLNWYTYIGSKWASRLENSIRYYDMYIQVLYQMSQEYQSNDMEAEAKKCELALEKYLNNPQYQAIKDAIYLQTYGDMANFAGE